MLRKLFCSKFCLIFLIVFIAFGFLVYKSFLRFSLEDFLQFNFVQDQVEKQVGEDNADLIKVVPRFMGFTKPMTYLLLFQNNTELRPGGGFIGTYAIINVEKGHVEIIKSDGTENLDRNTPEDFKITPPLPITEHLGVDRWYFRDSNWSPDFSESAKQALALYKGENGVFADQIDAIIAITPTVLEEVLKRTGPVKVNDVKFSYGDVVEDLEFEVEYAFDKKGIHITDRKDIIGDLMGVILSKIKTDLIFNFESYIDFFNRMSEEKHIMVYSLDKELQEVIADKDLGGEVKRVDGDYLLWVDANLAALKTDHAIERELRYSISKDKTGRFLANAEMEYEHTGYFDWRTTRYRTYTRIFVPQGSELVSVDGAMKWDRTKEPGVVDEGEELDKKWFGTFIAIEPGQTKTLKFSYYLPGDIYKDDLYTLFVQKQLGSFDHKLTLDLNFGTNIRTAKPSEDREEVGDDKYVYQTDLKIDREFEVGF
jgi:hypothetical protein